MLNDSELSAINDADAAIDTSLNTRLFEFSQRHRLKTSVLLVIALATLTWGFSVAKTDVINAEVDVASFQSAHATQLNSVNASVPNIPSLNPFKAQLISLNESAAAHDLPALPTVGMQFRSQDEKTQ